MALASSFSDNFDLNSISASWSASALSNNSAEVLVQNNRCEVSHTAASEYNALSTAATYDLTGNYALCQIVDAGNQTIASHECIFLLQLDANNKLWFTISGNNIKAFKKVAAGANTQVGSNLAYDATQHKWFRFREASGTVYWDISSEGRVWINQWSLGNPFAVTALTIALQCGCFSAESIGSHGYFDNYNFALAQKDLFVGVSFTKEFQVGNGMSRSESAT